MSDDARRAARGSVALGLTQVIIRVGQLGFVVVAARAVSPENFGRYSVAAALLVFGGFIGDFGTGQMITRTVSRDPHQADRLLSGTLIVSAGMGVIGWMAIVVFALASYDQTTVIDVALAGASLPLTAASTSLAGALDGSGRFFARSMANMLHASCVAIGGAALLALTHEVRWAIAAIPVGALFGLGAGWAAAKKASLITSALRVDFSESLRLIHRSIPFALFAGLGALSARFDVTLLSLVDGRKAAAAYDIALRGTEALWYLHSLVTGPTLYLLSRRLGARDQRGAQRAFDEAIRLSYLSGLLASALIVGLHQPLVHVLGGDGYTGAGTALALLGGGLFLTFVGLVQGTLILAGDHHRAGLRVASGLTAATLVLDAVLVPVFGIRGAAVAGVVTSLLTCLAFASFARRHEGLSTAIPPAGVALAATVTCGVAWSLREWPVIAGTTACVTYLILLLLSRAIQRDDLIRARTMLGRSRPEVTDELQR